LCRSFRLEAAYAGQGGATPGATIDQSSMNP